MQWVCDICGYVHEEDEPPEICPVCGAPQSKFSEADQDWDEDVPKEADAVEDVDEDIVIEPEAADDDEVEEDGDDDDYFDEDDFEEYADEDEDR